MTRDSFIKSIAGMKCDGEGGFSMGYEDAVQTLGRLILDARDLATQPPSPAKVKIISATTVDGSTVTLKVVPEDFNDHKWATDRASAARLLNFKCLDVHTMEITQ